EPEVLGVYLHGGRRYSSLLEFFALLVNGEFQRVPLPRAPIANLLATTRLLFGSEVIEYRLPTCTRFGAVLGIKEYPTPTVVGMGDHHFTLQVLAEAPRGADGDGRFAELNDRIALARTLLADTGMTVAREDLGLEGAFWAQLPGNFGVRPRRSPITSRNFAA